MPEGIWCFPFKSIDTGPVPAPMRFSAFIVCLGGLFLVFNHISLSSDYQGEKEKKKENANMNHNGSKMKLKDLVFHYYFSNPIFQPVMSGIRAGILGFFP